MPVRFDIGSGDVEREGAIRYGRANKDERASERDVQAGPKNPLYHIITKSY